jgi:hypothetical protein
MITVKGWVILDSEGKMQGIDESSGGYPYSTDNILGVHFWTYETEAEKYRKIIDGGKYSPAKGYRLAPFTFTVEDGT